VTAGLHRPGTGRSNADGFTLVELLVVLAIFSLMSLVLFDGFHFATSAAANGNARVERAQEIALASAFLRKQFADIRPFPIGGPDDAKTVAFDGSPEGLVFVGAPPAYLSPGGFQELRIGLEPTQQGQGLTVRWRPVRNDGITAIGGQPPSILIDGIAETDFAYFGSTAPRAPPTWNARWSGAAGLPALIRLRVTFRDGHAAPDLIVALRPAEPAFQ
jgi:general secretion pathway protein J